MQPFTHRPFQGRGDAGQRVAQAVGQPGLVGGQVDVKAVEDPQLREQLIRAGVQPVHLLAPGPAGVGEDVGVAPVGLGLAGIQVRGAAHHQARHIRHRDAPAGGDRQGELGDRAGLVDHQARRPMPGSAVQQRLQVRLALATARANSRSPSLSRTSAKCSLLPTSSPTHTSTCPGCGHLMPLPARSAWSHAREGRRRCARRHPPYESAIKPHVPIRGLRTSGAGGNTPQAIPAAGGKEPCRHRRPSRARTLLARAH